MRSTHTYVILEISPAAHAEIKAKLLAAGYQHAIDGDTIDMHGIAVEPERDITFNDISSLPAGTKVSVSDTLVVDSGGKLHGSEDDMAAFRKFAAARDALLKVDFNVDEHIFSRL